ncbi:MAG: hypothetical protein SGI73_06770, partial [Chloroflexota bacterium]|nr:hypothetical protein [Chloroflexota bacterium]
MKKLSVFLMPFALLVAAFFIAATPKLQEVEAQADMCPQLVSTALETTNEACDSTGRNRACYGHALLEAESTTDSNTFVFQQVGDQVDVENIRSLRLSELNVAANYWGIALMRLQANLPSTKPGSNVTVLMFGNVALQNTLQSDTRLGSLPISDDERSQLQSMQAFYFQSDDEAQLCPEVPASGMVIQTPEGEARVRLWINGVRIDLGSTAYIRSQPGNEMIISLVEGSAQISTTRGSSVAVAGSEVLIDVDTQGQAVGIPSLPQAYNLADIPPSIFAHLERPISPPPPLSDFQVLRLQQGVISGEAICGVDPYPLCVDV